VDTQRRLAAALLAFPRSHPSFSLDGQLFATDLRIGREGNATDLWAVAIGSLSTSQHRLVQRFENGLGSTSWRRSHPHPSFRPDGKRLYFNVSADRWTRLFVAELDSGG
jgi:Tol biopolymer transport system component